MERIVIAGAGLAGHRAAQALRRNGFDGQLVLVGDEEHRPYDRPPLSKQLLGGECDSDQCFYMVDDLDVNWTLGRPATSLDVGAQSVTLEDGTRIRFDGLVIATGRRARTLPLASGMAGVHTLRSLDDALTFRDAISPITPVAIIGAGFIGCEVAATLRKQGVENVTLIDVAPYPMPALGPEVGERAARLHRNQGVRLRLANTIEKVEGTARVQALRLRSGESIAAEQVLVAVGSQPNSEWLEDSGLRRLSSGAVVCDEYCFAVGTENVVVVGDVAAWPHRHGDGPVCIEHWTNARDMAAVGAANLIADPGEREPLRAVPTFWSDQYNVKIKSAGYLGAANRYVVVNEDPQRPSLAVEAYRGDELVGAIVFNKNRTIIDYQRRLAAASA